MSDVPDIAYEADGARVSAEAFYALACEPGRSVVVEACAGAGKTWMLVSRMLRALLAGTQPEQIVAITFTRKAAAEMRARLQEWVDDFAQATPAQCAQALRERGLDAAAAQAQAGTLQGLAARLRDAPHRVQVSTFHAWFQQLLRAAPLAVLAELGLPPERRLLEQEDELMLPMRRRFQAQVMADAALRADFLGLAARHGHRALQEWLLAAWQRRVEIEWAGERAQASVIAPQVLGDDRHPGDLLALLQDELDALLPHLGQGKKNAQTAAERLRAALAMTDPWQRWRAVCAALLNDEGVPRKLDGTVQARADAVALQLQQLDQAVAQAQARRDHLALLRLAHCQNAVYAELKRERGGVDQADLERAACALLLRDDAAAWLQQRLDLQVRQLLIDEFQDTSPLQWQALLGWLSSYAGAGSRAPAVFIVGDPKQSIYRFRGAEPRVFAQAQAFVVQGLGGHRLACDHTRRNAPAVRAAVNALFGQLQAAGHYGGFRAHSGSEPAGGDGVYLLEAPPPAAARAPDDDDSPAWRDSLRQPRQEPELARRRAEAERVAAVIDQLLAQGAAPSSLMVLARRREALDELATALRQRALPHATDVRLQLAEVPEVADLLALCDALASPAHDAALARALRSSLFGVPSEALLALHEQAGEGAWTQALAHGDWQAHPELAQAQALWRAWQHDALPSWPPLEALLRVLRDTDMAARLRARLHPDEAQWRWAAVQALLEATQAWQGGRYGSLYGLLRTLRAFDRPWVRPPSAEGVQLLTVHGAKGLEADTVILLDADAQPPKAQSTTLLIDWPAGQRQPQRLAFLRSESAPPPLLQTLMDEEKAARRREAFNGLYVAMTRARRRLIVSRTPPKGRSPADSAWTWLQALDLPAWPLAQAPCGGDAAPEPRQFWALPERQVGSTAAAPPRQAADDPLAARLGEALHRVLEWATQPGRWSARTAARQAWCAAAAQIYALDAAGVQRLRQGVDALLDSAEAAPFLDPARLRWAGNEVALVDAGQEIRLDRLVQREDGVWWVLDYKLHPAPLSQPAYVAQMQGYVKALQALHPSEPVRGAFLSADGRLHAL